MDVTDLHKLKGQIKEKLLSMSTVKTIPKFEIYNTFSFLQRNQRVNNLNTEVKLSNVNGKSRHPLKTMAVLARNMKSLRLRLNLSDLTIHSEL